MKKKALIFIMFFSCTAMAQKNTMEFRGLYAGAQTISVIKKGESFYHSVYMIGMAGIKKWTFNTQFIVPVFPATRPLIKFGIDYKIF